MRDIWLVVLFATACGFAPIALALAPQAGKPVAIVAAPWAPAAIAIVAEADGSLIDPGDGGSVAIAMSDDPDFVSRLYRSGAALVLDAKATGLCSNQAGKLAAQSQKS